MGTVLKVKICCTIVLWSVPLLVTPSRWLFRFGIPASTPVMIVRLLGAAYAALLVGYVLGLRDWNRHHTMTDAVRTVVWTGVVSNGLASLTLLLAGIRGTWSDWGSWARGGLWLSAVLTSLITTGLLWTLFPQSSLKPAGKD